MNFNKEAETLEKFIEKLNLKKEKLELQIEKRNDIYSDRTESWQESDVGLDYEEITEGLEDHLYNLETVIDELTTAVEMLREIDV